MPIYISNRLEAEITYKDFDAVISISNPFVPVPFKGPVHLEVFFEDTEHPNSAEYFEMVEGVSSIIDFVRKQKFTNETKILVHCHEGISRSSSIAWIILLIINESKDEESFKKHFQTLYKQRPKIDPNIIIMMIADSILGFETRLWKTAQRISGEIAINKQSYLGYCNE